MEQFDYSSFFEGKKTVTLGEVQQYFGFLHLRDIRKIVDEILAFEGVTRGVIKPGCKIHLTPNRVSVILDGIHSWQSRQGVDIIKNYKKGAHKRQSLEVSVEISKTTGITYSEFHRKYIDIPGIRTRWNGATRIRPEWFNSQFNGRAYVLKPEYENVFKNFCLEWHMELIPKEERKHEKIMRDIESGMKYKSSTRSI